MFFNAKEERTRYKYLLYYTFSFLENSAIIAVWFSHLPNVTDWYVFPAMIGHYLAFFAGIMFMLCYYLWCHPTGIDIAFLKMKRRVSEGKGTQATEMVEIEEKVVVERCASSPHLETVTDGERGPTSVTSRFLRSNSETFRRSSSVPLTAVDLGAARKLKYMGRTDKSVEQA